LMDEGNRSVVNDLIVPPVGPLHGQTARKLRGLAIDARSIFISDRSEHVIQAYSACKATWRTIGGLGSNPGQLKEPTELCVYKDELYICDAGNRRLQVWDAITHAFKREWHCGIALSLCIHREEVVIGTQRSLQSFIVTHPNDSVSYLDTYTLDGKKLSSIDVLSVTQSACMPYGIALTDSHIFVTDICAPVLKLFDRSTHEKIGLSFESQENAPEAYAAGLHPHVESHELYVAKNKTSLVTYDVAQLLNGTVCEIPFNVILNNERWRPVKICIL
jgi:hypothetical protein